MGTANDRLELLRLHIESYWYQMFAMGTQKFKAVNGYKLWFKADLAVLDRGGDVYLLAQGRQRVHSGLR